jgi:asparagine synthase (glutamine-hydrolysing)
MAKALDRMRQRGPDDSGVWNDAHVQLGHRRLAIIDLSETGHQPMISSDGRFVVVFNGEIYNHAELRPLLDPVGGWRGSSDTETLLEAYRCWGTDCLARLNGMFAFAIWDRVERRLFAARDRLGVKPFYYARHGSLLGFASRPGALRALHPGFGSSMNPVALSMYLDVGYVPTPLGLHLGESKLPPAHYLLADEAGLRCVRYWDYRHIGPETAWNGRTEDDLLDELDDLVRRAVRARLLADVPVGAFLSSGVDSALVVAAMCREGLAPPRAFTIGFRERDYDESVAAAAIARHLGVDHVVETLSVQSLLNLLPQFVEQYDEPFADSSAFPTMAVTRLAARQVKVALTGDGGDEAFGGYHYYGIMEHLGRVAEWRPRMRDLLSGVLSRLPGHRNKLMAAVVRRDSPSSQFHFLRSIAKDFGPLVAVDSASAEAHTENLVAQFAASLAVDLSGAEIGMRLDTGFVLPNLYLQKVDVASMAYSLEARCPLTDYRIVEWAARLPLKFKLRDGASKYLLKKLLARYLPAEQVYRPKRGFGVPVAAWLRGPLHGWAEQLFNDSRAMRVLPLERDRLLRLLQIHCSGARDAHPVLWAALMLICYVNRHELGDALPAVPQPGRKAA